MNTPYQDLQTLGRTGCWPNYEVPAWAQREADKLQCDTTLWGVMEYAYKDEIQRLTEERDSFRSHLAQLGIEAACFRHQGDAIQGAVRGQK